ncbi:MAG: mono/diheme cytochrome c family protein [Mariniblastus sp.]|jgi:mono/diheme cytochrome c family protein
MTWDVAWLSANRGVSHRSQGWIALLGIAALGFVNVALATDESTLSFNRDISPILSENCFACHGPDAQHREAGLRLDVPKNAWQESATGPAAIVPGDVEASALWQRIIATDPDEIMPPASTHKTLTTAQKRLIRRWIEAGAKYEEHWAFIPPVHSEVRLEDRNPIDFFIRRQLAAANSGLSKKADRETVLRRLSFDLTGLPPTPEELDRFVQDSASGAYERQVDRLLASPRFGEQMAAHWLDLARYSDSNGYLQDVLRTGWPWRDWVINAFNQDMPFDQFTIEQLAGDLLPDAQPNQVLATAFLRNHPISVEGGTLAAEYLNEYASDRVETVGTVFLGLTFNCCRCHDHKFDALPQKDYYSLLSYFNSSTEQHKADSGTAPAYQPFIEIDSPLETDGQVVGVMVMDEGETPRPTFVLKRGQYDQPDESQSVSRRPPGVLGPPLEGAPADRLGLARWLVSKQNPLLARVTVNRLWHNIFGRGLVESVDDFGVQGTYPSHPKLLDYLAVEYQKTWRTKQLLRLMVTSETYQQASTARLDLSQVDPENRLLGYFPRRRLTAEQIRDAALFTSGLLVEKLGGAPVRPYQPPGLWSEKANPGSTTGIFVRGSGDDLYRRSIYTFHKRNSPPPTMSLFDAPERNGCSARRSPTNTPLQALATLNDEQHLECAKVLASRTLKLDGTTNERLVSLFRRVTGRNPSSQDLGVLSDGLSRFESRFQSAPKDALALLKQGVYPGDGTSRLVSVTIPDDTKTDANGYAYATIQPVTLVANAEYLIGGEDTNAFWDADIFGAQGNAFTMNPAASLIASQYAKEFGKPTIKGQKHAGRWAVGNAKFRADPTSESSKTIPLFDFEPAQVNDPQDRRGPLRLTIGNLFRVGNRDIEITELGLHDANGGAFKGGKVGLWSVAETAAGPVIDAGMDPGELASWMLIASTVLNLDETIVQD